MRSLRNLGMLAVAGVLAVMAAVPAVATTTYHESYSFTGVMAQADWFSEQEVPLGTPQAVAVMGADAQSMLRVAGQKPVRMAQPAVVAMGMMTTEGPQELWCISQTDYTFTYTSALDAATLDMQCTAEVYVVDPETGEEVSTGETIPLTATATWTGDGPLAYSKYHARDAGTGVWRMERTRSQVRPAVAYLTVTGPTGAILFDGQMGYGEIANVTGGTLYHEG